jgi:hypothetical protein
MMVRRFCILAVTKQRMLRSLARRESGGASSSFAAISLIWRSRSTSAALSATDPDIPIFIAAKTGYAKL